MTVEDVFRNIAFPLLRFTTFSAHALILGILGVLILVLRPSFRSLGGPDWAAGRKRVAERLEGLVRGSLAASVLATVLILVLQAALFSELGTGEVDPTSLGAVLETTFGQWVALRLPLVAALAVLLVGRIRVWGLGGIHDDKQPSRAWWVAWATLGTVLLLTSSFSGHALVGKPRALSITNDLVHMVAAALWFTGIVVLAAVLPDAWRKRDALDRLRLLTPNVVRFSNVALVTIAIVAVTGTINSFLHVGRLSDLWETSYGQALFFKLGLFGFILALGAVNHFVVRRELESAVASGEKTQARRTFRKTIAIELALAVAIMATTGLLTYLGRTKETPTEAPNSAASIERARTG